MTPQESLMVLRKVVAYQPNQRVDELTPDAWAEALEPYDVRDALDAVKKLALAPRNQYRPPFIEIGDIVNEVRSVEHDRYERRQHHLHDVPSEIYADTDRYHEWYRAGLKAIQSRDWTPPEEPERPELPARPVESLIKQIGRIRNGGHPEAAPIAHCPGCNCEGVNA